MRFQILDYCGKTYYTTLLRFHVCVNTLLKIEDCESLSR